MEIALGNYFSQAWFKITGQFERTPYRFTFRFSKNVVGEFMLYHPPSPSKENTPGHGLLRVLGALLSLVSIVLAILGAVYQNTVLSLIFSVFIALFALRVFVLWLNAHHMPSQQSMTVVQPATYSMEQYYAENQPVAQGYSQTIDSVYKGDNFGAHYATSVPYTPPPYTSATPYTPHTPLPSYSAQPAYVVQSSAYTLASPTGAYEQGQVQSTPAQVSYAPLVQDALFMLDMPTANERCFMLAKEGKPLVECQDSYALHNAHRCYAVADGVADSFVPGPWARIIAKRFVERNGKFANKEDFQAWLLDCSQQWQSWIENRWVPTMHATYAMHAQHEPNGVWQDNLLHDLQQGAQTTLVGCSLVSNTEEHDLPTSATVFAIGNSEFFLFSPNHSGGYEIAETFPFSDPNEFASCPDTLVTAQRTELLERAWVRRKTMNINVFSGDIIVLATDALAKWLLMRVYQNSNKWLSLLTSNSAAEFEQRVREELHNGQLEDDDLTLLVIPIA